MCVRSTCELSAQVKKKYDSCIARIFFKSIEIELQASSYVGKKLIFTVASLESFFFFFLNFILFLNFT